MYDCLVMPADNSAYPISTFNTVVLTSTSPTSMVLAGGATFGGNVTVTGSLTGGSISYTSTTTGTLAVSNSTGTTFTVASTQNSTSVGTGAFVAQGGGSFAGNLYVGGSLVAGSVTYATTNTGTMNITTGTGTTLAVSSTTDSTTQSNGSATFLGGIGVAKRINTGSLKCFDNTQSTSTTTGCLQLVGGFGCLGNGYLGGSLNVTSSTAATSKTTGSAVFVGGIGVGGQVFCDSLETTGNALIGGSEVRIANLRAMVNNGTFDLVLNFDNDFVKVIVDSDLQVTGNISSANSGTILDTDLLLYSVGPFTELPYLHCTVAKQGTNTTFTSHYRFTLPSGSSYQFETYFTSLLTLLDPLNRVVMGTGYVTGFNAPALVGGLYDASLETRFMYPISGMIEMKQEADPTPSGIPDASEGYQYIFRVFNADPFIQLPITLPSSNQIEYNPDESTTSTGPETLFEVVVTFQIPSQ